MTEKPQENISSKIVAAFLIISAILFAGGVWVLSRPVGNVETVVNEPAQQDPQIPEELIEQEPVAPVEPVGDPQTISGQVTEAFEDCSRRRVLEAGVVVEKQDITCDGGSYVVVDQVQIYTASGFVPREQAFFVDISAIIPCDEVEVVYEAGKFQNTLNCDECRLTVVSQVPSL